MTFVRSVAWLALAAVVIVTLGPLADRPRLADNPQLERFLAFMGLGALFSVAYPRRRVAIASLVITGALGLEAAQRLTRDRHGEVSDAAIKAMGGLLGVTGVELIQAMKPGPRPRP